MSDHDGTSMRRCTGRTTSGSECKAPPMGSAARYFWHSSVTEGERRKAQQRGGQSTRAPLLPALVPEFSLRDNREIAEAAVWLFQTFLKGELGTKETYTAGYVLNVVGKARDAGRLEERLEALEAALKKPRSAQGFLDGDAIGGEDDREPEI